MIKTNPEVKNIAKHTSYVRNLPPATVCIDVMLRENHAFLCKVQRINIVADPSNPLYEGRSPPGLRDAVRTHWGQSVQVDSHTGRDGPCARPQGETRGRG